MPETRKDVEASILEMRTKGIPEAECRAYFESRLGNSMSDVRLHHADEKLKKTGSPLTAKAFATGDDIQFRKGEYDPSSSSGKALLGHELTHTVQQK